MWETERKEMAEWELEVIISSSSEESTSEENSFPSREDSPSEENSPSAIIYRVPEQLRETNKNAYKPKVVSIGPYHHGKHSLQAGEIHKRKYLAHLISITKVTEKSYREFVRLREHKLRACYAELIVDADNFVEIVLVDAAFIIVFLLGLKYEKKRPEEDYMFRNSGLAQWLWPDLLLLENQLPFFILEDLFPYGVTYTVNGEQVHFLDLLRHFFETFPKLEVPDETFKERCRSKIEHFVDFQRRLYIPWAGQPNQEPRQPQDSPPLSIKKLQQAGVTFEGVSSRNLFDLQFSDGILKIPKLIIGRETDISISNLLAFEQFRHPNEMCINDYIVIMNALTTTEEDVQLLIDRGIVENRLPNEKFLFNKFAEGICHREESYFANLMAELRKHCGRAPRNWRAFLVKNFFQTPLGTVTLTLSVVAIILTVFQMVLPESKKPSESSG